MNKSLNEKFNKLKEFGKKDEKLGVAIEEIYKEVDKETQELEDEIHELKDQLDDKTNEYDLTDLKAEIEKLTDNLPKNVYDEMKKEVCDRLMNNLTLEQIVKSQFKDSKKIYNTFLHETS